MPLPSTQLPFQPFALVKGTDGRYGLQAHSSSAVAPATSNVLGSGNSPASSGLGFAINSFSAPPSSQAAVATPVLVHSYKPRLHNAIGVPIVRQSSSSPVRAASPSTHGFATRDYWLEAQRQTPRAAYAVETSDSGSSPGGGLGFEPPARPLPSRERLERLAPEVAPPERLRTKLLDLGTSFVGLDKKVEEDMRKCKEIEQKRVQDILGVLVELEKTLITEVQRREAASQTMQQGLEKLLENMVDRVQSKIVDRFAKLSQSVEGLCERCSTVERGIRQFKGEVPSKLRVETARLKQKIRELSKDFQSDRRRRIDQDTGMTRELEELEYNLDLRMQQELAQLERQMETLQEVIDAFASGDRSEETTALRISVMESIAEFRNDLAHEAEMREKADDQVVQAINDYSSMLYRSLRASATA